MPDLEKFDLRADVLFQLQEIFQLHNIPPHQAAAYCGFLIGYASDNSEASNPAAWDANAVENFRINLAAGRRQAKAPDINQPIGRA